MSQPRVSVQRAAYLLGLSGDPGITQEEIDRDVAMQAIYSALDGGPISNLGQFGPSGQANEQRVSSGMCPSYFTVRSYLTIWIAAVIVRVPLKTTTAGAATTCRDIPFDIQIIPNDFLDRISAYAGVECASNSLGWRFTTDRRTDPIHRLVTSEDVQDAFKMATERLSNKRIKKEVVIEIVDLVCYNLSFVM
jgi:hypothetical protein